jgi:hypothetical protein
MSTTQQTKSSHTIPASSAIAISTNNSQPSSSSAAQYIYNTMQSSTGMATNKPRPILRKNSTERSNSSNLANTSQRSLRSAGLCSIDLFDDMNSMDLNHHVDPRGGLLTTFANGVDSKRSINSSDFVKDAFLSSEDHFTGGSNRDLVRENDKNGHVLDLTSKLERITTGDDIMGENIRLSSSEWIGDLEDDGMMGELGPMPQSMFYNSASDISAVTSNANVVPSSVEVEHVPSSVVAQPLTSTSSNIITSSSTTKKQKNNTNEKKNKKKRKRIIDETTTCTPTELDVLFGRGGYTNNRPGNIFFRSEALRLRPWYESSTKEEKYEISQLLMESVKSRGGRFLEKGKKDGMWHEVIGNGARRKASQALRERIRGNSGHGRRERGTGAKNLNSSLTTVKSVSGDEREDFDVRKVEV